MDKLDSKPLFNIVSGITILCIIVGSQWYLCPEYYNPDYFHFSYSGLIYYQWIFFRN